MYGKQGSDGALVSKDRVAILPGKSSCHAADFPSLKETNSARGAQKAGHVHLSIERAVPPHVYTHPVAAFVLPVSASNLSLPG